MSWRHLGNETQATVSEATGEITRVVDIAEAPWRVVGLALLPIISLLSIAAAAKDTADARAIIYASADAESAAEGAEPDSAGTA